MWVNLPCMSGFPLSKASKTTNNQQLSFLWFGSDKHWLFCSITWNTAPVLLLNVILFHLYLLTISPACCVIKQKGHWSNVKNNNKRDEGEGSQCRRWQTKRHRTEMKHLEVMIRYYCSAVMSGDDEGMRNFDKLFFRGLFFLSVRGRGRKGDRTNIN